MASSARNITPHARNYVYIAGGVGITPASARCGRFRSPGKTPDPPDLCKPDWDSVIFREEIEELEKSLNLRVVHVLEKPPNNWKGYQVLSQRKFSIRNCPKNVNQTTQKFLSAVPGR